MNEYKVYKLLTQMNGDITVKQLQAQMREEGCMNLDILNGVKEWLYEKEVSRESVERSG